MSELIQRNKEIKNIEKEIEGQLAQIPNENQIEWLSRQISATYSKLMGVKYQNDRFLDEMRLDTYKSHIERLGKFSDDDEDQGLWQGYPELNDPSFNRKIYEKQEFYKYKIPKQSINQLAQTENVSGKVREVILSPTQNFIGSYMSPSTPFNGLLLWLGVGVGKTCAAITAAENYRKEGGEFARSKIIILLPADTLVKGWKKELFNVEKDTKNKNKSINVQCTGATFYPELGFYDEMDDEQKERRVNKVINKYYEFLGYRKFSNRVMAEINEELKGRQDREYLKIQVIRKKYSNRVFILDEVHFTREYASKNDMKEITEVLELIARYGVNNKFILASATPMYNSPEEIIEILNILLLNDKRSPIQNHQVFKSGGEVLTENGKNILVEKSRGYISYLRGENPVTFPFKLYPQLDKPVKTYKPNPKYTLKKGKLIELDEADKIKDLFFVKCNMSSFQYSTYKSIARTEDDDDKKDNFSIPSTQASNIVFPYLGEGVEQGKFGDDGFDEVFDLVKQGDAVEDKSNYRYRYKEYNAFDENGIPFLDESRLEKYSMKYYNILQLAKNSTGIVFLFSRYLKPGITSLALTLEQNGYARFSENKTENNMLDGAGINIIPRCYCGKLLTEHSKIKDHSFQQGRYIFLTGETPKKTLSRLIEYSNMEKGGFPNLYGQSIKFILGSNVLEQGVNMFNVREVHVIDPWYHFNRLEQVVGRAIRNYSHINLPPDERNVSVFLHCSTIPLEDEKNPKLSIETTDEKNYRISYGKTRKMAPILRTLKQNAVDCMLNKNGNQLTIEYFGNTPLKVVTSQGVVLRNQFYGDKDNDVMCDYEKCNYDCVGEPEGPWTPKINTDTYEDILSMVDLSAGKKNIISIFRLRNSYTIEEIMGLMSKYFSIDRDLTYRALNSMVLNKDPVYDSYKREGHLSYVHPYYVFTPKELNNEFSSLYSRSLPLPIRKNEIVVSDVDENLVKLEKKKVDIVGPEGEIEDTSGFIGSFLKFIGVVGKEYISNDNIYGKISQSVNREFVEALGLDSPQLALELIEQYFIFAIIDRLPFVQKQALIAYVLAENIKRDGKELDGNQPKAKLERIVFEFYDKKGDSHRYCIFRQKRDLGETGSSDLPLVFRLIRQVKITKKDGTTVNDYEMLFYEYNFETKRFEQVINPIKQDKYREELKPDYAELKLNENDKVYGYVQEKEHRAHYKQKAVEEIGEITAEPEFYLVNRRFHVAKKNKDDTLQQKSEIKGAVCGTCTDKAQLITIIKYLLDIEGENDIDSFLQSKSKVNKHVGIYESFAKSGSLCELIELMLRHRQFIQPTEHFFYNYEEWLYMRSVRAKQEQEQKKAEEETKLMKPKATRGRKPSATKKK